MSNLESIVPPLELCKQIPEGEFEDSALVWVKDPDGIEMVLPREVAQFEHDEMVSAPTLEEIINELPDEYRDGRLDIGTYYLEYITYDEFLVDGAFFSNEPEGFAAAALRMWFKVKGIEVK